MSPGETRISSLRCMKARWSVAAIALIIGAFSAEWPSTDATDPADGTTECNKCSIYILDLASFAPTHGYPVCDLNKVVVDPTTGVVYLKEKDTGIKKKVSHKYGTHSAPWYLQKVRICLAPLEVPCRQ